MPAQIVTELYCEVSLDAPDNYIITLDVRPMFPCCTHKILIFPSVGDMTATLDFITGPLYLWDEFNLMPGNLFQLDGSNHVLVTMTTEDNGGTWVGSIIPYHGP